MITSRSFGLHATHTTRIVAYACYTSVEDRHRPPIGVAIPQMVLGDPFREFLPCRGL